MKEKMAQLINSYLEKLSPQQLEQLDSWAKNCKVIVENKSLTPIMRAKALGKIKTPSTAIMLMKEAAKLLKKKAWDGQTWFVRLGGGGLIAGAAIFGSQAAGLASGGFGISISIALIVGLGGSFLGGLIDQIQKVKTPRPNQPQETDVRDVTPKKIEDGKAS